MEENKHPLRGVALEAGDAAALGPDVVEGVRKYLWLWPNHDPTPLRRLPGMARTLGIGALAIKDESERFGLGSFKALGGSYAVMRLAAEYAARGLGRPIGPDNLGEPDVRAALAGFTVGCATDGNHGRSVAAGAQMVGCRAAIFVHAGVSEERVSAIARFGAEIVRVEGIYDDAVAEAERRCRAEGWTVVSDTSWPGYEHIPLTVMQGYTVMVAEALAEMTEPPTHVFLQAGVGGFAAATASFLALALKDRRPRIVVVEPERAACLFESNRAGRLVRINHGQPTVMAMLECYEPSLVAWRILTRLADAYMTVGDDAAVRAMQHLAAGSDGDPPVVAGESGGAGFAALLELKDDSAGRRMLGLDSGSRVLLFNTEGATDAATYERLTGRSAHDVIAARKKARVS